MLNPEELAVLKSKRFAKRRIDWLHGRLVAKKLINRCHPQAINRALNEIIIASEPGGAPFSALPGGARLPGWLSISHSASLAAAALSTDSQVQVGIDLEEIAARSPGFFENFFTPREIAYVQAGGTSQLPARLTLIWSAKESVLKAMRTGLARDTRSIEVIPSDVEVIETPPEGWRRFNAAISPGEEAATQPAYWRGWWTTLPGFILTLMASCQDKVLYERLDRSIPLQVC